MIVNQNNKSVPCICMTFPLFTRVLEYIREDVKNDSDLHFILEEIISLSQKEKDKCLDMNSYQPIIDIIEKRPSSLFKK